MTHDIKANELVFGKMGSKERTDFGWKWVDLLVPNKPEDVGDLFCDDAVGKDLPTVYPEW
jgi:hypothetical protein